MSGPTSEDQVAQKFPVQAPEKILQSTICLEKNFASDFGGQVWNEVRYGRSSTKSAGVKITGIFYRQSVPQAALGQLRLFGMRFGVPVIEL